MFNGEKNSVRMRFSIHFQFTGFEKSIQIVNGNSVAEAVLFYPLPTTFFLIVEK
jgi:hypothetical protein